MCPSVSHLLSSLHQIQPMRLPQLPLNVCLISVLLAACGTGGVPRQAGGQRLGQVGGMVGWWSCSDAALGFQPALRLRIEQPRRLRKSASSNRALHARIPSMRTPSSTSLRLVSLKIEDPRAGTPAAACPHAPASTTVAFGWPRPRPVAPRSTITIVFPARPRSRRGKLALGTRI